MFGPRPIDDNQRLNPRQRAVVLAMNILLLVEMAVSIYLGQQNPENLTIIFLRTYLPLLIVTLIAARVLIRKLSDGTPSVMAAAPSAKGN
jgi:hypothetical protein